MDSKIIKNNPQNQIAPIANYHQEQKNFFDVMAGKAPLWWRKEAQESMDAFIQQGFPSKGQEMWRFMPMGQVQRQTFRHHRSTASSTSSATSAQTLSEAEQEKLRQFLLLPGPPRLVFLNGEFSPQYSEIPSAQAGMTFASLGEVLQVPGAPSIPGPELSKVREWLHFPFLQSENDTYRDCYQNSFLSLGRAFLSEGTIISLQAGTVIPEVWQVVFVTTKDFQGAMHHPRNIFQVGREAQLTILEEHLHLGDEEESVPYLSNSVSDFFLEEGARVQHIKVQLEGRQGIHIGHTRAHLKRDAHFHSFSFNLGAAISRHHVAIQLSAPGATCRADGLYALQGQQHGENYTLIDHAAPHTQAHQLYKGILAGTSHGVFNGRVLVRPGTLQVDSNQLNKNLLLNKLAQIHTQPQLEIYASDVKCGHGAAIGQINADEVFYLQTRGIPADRARKMLAHAFAHDALMKIPHSSVRELLDNLLVKHFERPTGLSLSQNEEGDN